MAWAARGLALILPLPAGLAVWAIALRVGQYGWTPERLFVAAMAGLAIGYGLSYAFSALRKSWRADIRSVNVINALAVLAVAALWLTPLFDAERIATNSQMARFAASGDPAVLDLWALDQWGRAGAVARAELQVLAAQPGQQALADVLAGNAPDISASIESARADLTALLPLQPVGATAQRDAILAAATVYDLQSWTASCTEDLPGGGPACVMVVADFHPDKPGDEAMFAQYSPAGYISYSGLWLDGNLLQTQQISPRFGDFPEGDAALAALRALQAAAPVLAPAPLNMLVIGENGLIMAP
jgi:hypothetical protein